MINFILFRINLILNSFRFRLLVLRKGGWVSFRCKLIIHEGSNVSVGNNVKIAELTKIVVASNASLNLCDGIIINHLSTIYCRSSIHIGSNTRVSHLVSIVDHNYHYDHLFGRPDFHSFKASPISIGSNVWIGATSVILRGSVIPDSTIVPALTRFKGA